LQDLRLNNGKRTMKPRAIIFDAYGTLFDVHSFVLRHADIAGDLRPLAAMWRQKQLEYTWLLSLMQKYIDFWEITGAALRSAVQQLEIVATGTQLDRLMQGYLSASVFADAKYALESMERTPLAILSNGSPMMLENVVRHNGLETSFVEIISVDLVKTYKPSPQAYALGPEILKVPPEQILFVSSNWWDAAGVKFFGYKVCWCNRAGAVEEHLGFPADVTVPRLDQIGPYIQAPHIQAPR
jgi:2-haloacid dehalogenase